MDANTIISASKNTVFSEVSGEAVILNMNDGVYYGLDPVGVSIWKALQQPTEVQGIHAMLLGEYDVDPEQCLRDLVSLLEQLRQNQLLEVHVAAAQT